MPLSVSQSAQGHYYLYLHAVPQRHSRTGCGRGLLHFKDQIENAVEAAKKETTKPTAIIMETIKGKGVSFMENAVGWHGSAPNAEQYAVAMQELNARYDALSAE